MLDTLSVDLQPGVGGHSKFQQTDSLSSVAGPNIKDSVPGVHEIMVCKDRRLGAT